ncbi:MAG: EndoU domain-containing protein [Flammeovirgaceae bacterium]
MAKRFLSLWVLLSTLAVTLCAQTITEKTKRHIFQGEINRQGKAVGCHHINAINQYKTAQLVPNTRKNGPSGIFKAKVRVKDRNGRWIAKVSNGGYSTFFPETWGEEKTLEAIKEVYNNKRKINGDLYEGKTKDGIAIQFYAKPDGFIASAFPKDWTR